MKTLKFIPIRFYKVYKYIFASDDDKYLTDLLIKETTDVDSKIVTMVDMEILDEPYRKDKPTVDLVTKLDDGRIVGIELDTKQCDVLVMRDLSYLSEKLYSLTVQGKSYEDLKKQYQINLDFENDFEESTKGVRLEVGDMSKERVEAYEIININIPYYVNLCYSKDVSELSMKERLLGMIGSEDIELSRKLAKGDKILEEILAKQIEYSQDEEIVAAYNKYKLMNEMQGYSTYVKYIEDFEEGIREGKIDEKINIVKNLRKNNIDIKTISEVTGLSTDFINGLK